MKEQLIYKGDIEEIDNKYRLKFIQLCPDDQIKKFLEKKTPNAQLVKVFCEPILKLFFTEYEIDGILHRYPMHLLSSEQWRTLVGEKRGGSLLDIGAGEGYVTKYAEGLFSKIVATETAKSMCQSLKKGGYEVYCGDIAQNPDLVSGEYDVVALLNVLDRCEMPKTLLKTAISKMKKNALLIIATPLPFHGHVVATVRGESTQKEKLFESTGIWEKDANLFFKEILESFEIEITKFTRLPYISRGSVGQVVLNDLVVVCRKK